MSNAKRNIAAIHSPFKQKYSIIIPAAGRGQRMKSYGPKSLIKIGDKTILDMQLEIIRSTFIQYEIILVSGFESVKMEKALPSGLKIVKNKHFETTNVAHSIALGLTVARNPNVLVVYGDLVLNKEALALPLMGESLITIDPSDYMKKDEVGCTFHQNNLVHMMYGLKHKWGQILYLTGKELSLFKKISTSQDCSKWFGFEMINEIMKKDGRFRSFTPKGAKSIDIDTSKDILRAEQLCQL